MSKTVFPIVQTKENMLISVNGDVSYFYELILPDLEQLSGFEVESFYNQVLASLNTFKENEYFKIYRLFGRSFLETSLKERVDIAGIELVESSEHLDLFFGNKQILSDIKFFDDYINFNGQYLRILSCIKYSEGEIDESLMPYDVDYVLNFKRIGKEVSTKRLDRVRTSHLSSFLKSKKDISGTGAYEQAEGLLEELTHGEENLFETELFFILREHSLDSLVESTKALQNYMSVKGHRLYIEGSNPLKRKSGLSLIFNELIPGVRPKIRLRVNQDKTSHLRYLLPLNKSHLMGEGVVFHDDNNDEIFFNPFDKNLKNRNMLVTGLSGGGKSVFVNKLVHSLIKKHPTVILDKGGSFKRLTTYHGGKTLSLGFNPMQFKDPMYLREFILSVVDLDQFNKLQRGRLLSEIKLFLNEMGDRTFEELLNHLDKSFKGISYYFEDIKEFFTSEKLEKSSILYVDVENFPKGIISPLIIFLLEYFKNIEEKEKILVFDECWSFLVKHAEFIDECFRTFRKSGAFPIAISQGLDDFKRLGDDLCNSITNNSYFKVFFPQELDQNSEVTDLDLEKISQLSFKKSVFSDCYLKSSDSKYRKLIRNYLSDLELELFHTESGEDDHLNKFLEVNSKFFQSDKEAIEAFIGLKYAKDTDSFNNTHSHLWNKSIDVFST